MKLVLNPKISFGPFYFKSRMSDYKKTYHFEYEPCPNDDVTGWDTYILNKPELIIYTEDEIIVSISSSEECILHGRNIAGMCYNVFLDLVKSLPSSTDKIYLSNTNTKQEVYDFEDLSIQLWVYNGKIVDVYVSC